MDLIEMLENDIRDIEILIDFCKENDYSKNVIFALTSLLIQKKNKLYKLIN